MSSAEKSLDSILLEIGDFGKYQKKNLFLICVAVIYTTIHLSFIFTAKDSSYRCKVENCDIDEGIYNVYWAANAVPLINGRPAKCEKYLQIKNSSESDDHCPADLFNKNQIEKCNEFVYETAETTIAKDFDLHCNENLWKLTLVGTINNLGHFICMPIAGFVSDRYGRKTLLIGGLTASAILGLIRSFSQSYVTFLVLEFLDTTFGTASFSCLFILGIELVGPERRVLIGTIISCAYTFGETLLALIAWYAQSWRLLLRIIYPPGLLILLYIWLVPESVRWLLTKGKTDEAIFILRKAAKVNRRTISPNALEKLSIKEEKVEQRSYPFLRVFKSLSLVTRVITCSFCWVTVTFLFYGLSLNAVALSGNGYLNFIMTALIEIPAFFATYLMMDKLGRRSSQFLSFILTGISCFAFIFIPDDKYAFKLCVYLLGKFGASVAFTVIYVFTSEMFPTLLRHSLLATCSMLGRIGSMIAPQVPVLAQVWVHLPLVLFGSMATAAGLLSLTFPETLNTQLPDTIEEAMAIGSSKKDLKNNCV